MCSSMSDYSRFAYAVVILVIFFVLSDGLVENVTVVECGTGNCTLSCFEGTDPFTWKYNSTLEKPQQILKGYSKRNIKVDEHMYGYFYCSDMGPTPEKIFYVTGQKVEQSSGSGALIAVTVLAVLFGIGFLIMVALRSLKFYKSRASNTLANGPSNRETSEYYETVPPTTRQPSVDDDDYILPNNPENGNSNYLEVLPDAPGNTTSGGPLYENLANIRIAQATTNRH